jgi:hypothetical protein
VSGIPSGYGPYNNQYFDSALANEVTGRQVVWTGKTPARTYEDPTGLSRVEFADGSWADLVAPAVHNAGPGDLMVTGIDSSRVYAKAETRAAAPGPAARPDSGGSTGAQGSPDSGGAL